MNLKLTVGRKLTLGVVALVLSLLLLSVTSLKAISTLGDSLDAAVNTTATKLGLIGSTQEAFQNLKSDSVREQIAYTILEMERRSSAEHQGRAAKGVTCASCHTPSDVGDSIRGLEAAGGVLVQRIEKLRRLVSDDAARNALDVVGQGASRWLASNKEYLALASGNRFEDAHAVLRDKMFPILEEVDMASKLLSERERAALARSNQQARSNISGSRWTAFVLIGVNLLVAAAVLWVVYRITGTLRRAVADMSEAAGQVASSIGQVTVASESLAQGACEQAASLEETSSSGEEIGSMARKNSENARAAAELVTRSQQSFAQTNRSLDQMVLAMSEIDSQSGKISKIIKVIDEIAFQTNILALNAAVEAARAGDAGLGFAVVADEVRNLAQRCSQAAKDTSGLIEESIAKSRDGKVKVDQVAAAIRVITEDSVKVKTLVDEVDLGSQEQSRGIEQIAKAISRIGQVTQSTAAQAGESATASSELTAQAQAINLVVLRLRSLITGDNRTSTHDQIQLALVAHASWKKRLADAIKTGSSGMAAGTVRLDDQCDFGKWLHGATLDQAAKQSADYQKSLELHRRFHIAAGNVLSIALAGRKDEARRAMEPASEFAKISDSLSAALTAWGASQLRADR